MLVGLDSTGHDIPVTIKYVIIEAPVDQICIVHVVAFNYFS